MSCGEKDSPIQGIYLLKNIATLLSVAFVILGGTHLSGRIQVASTPLGYSFNLKFTDEKATCMIVSDTIYVMLLKEAFFRPLQKKKL